jgi:hypothetical protein
MTGALAARRAALVALLLALAALLVAPSTASAAPGQVVKEDPTGAVFDCGDVTYTVTGGTVTFLFHLSFDAAGGEHVTGTAAPTGVTLTSSADNRTYLLAGASWFGGNFTAGGTSNFIDTQYFNIIYPGEGVVDRVAITAVFSMNANGEVTVDFVKDSGECAPPGGEE